MSIKGHLFKTRPLYQDGKGQIVKLLKVYKTDDGLCFTTQIMTGEHKGKWTQAFKNELKRVSP